MFDLIKFIKNPVKFCQQKSKNGDFVFKLNGKEIYCTNDKELINKIASISSVDLFEKEVIQGVLGKNIYTQSNQKKNKEAYIKALKEIDIDHWVLTEIYEYSEGKVLIEDLLIQLIANIFYNQYSNKEKLIYDWLSSITLSLLMVPWLRTKWNPQYKKFKNLTDKLVNEIQNLIHVEDSFPNKLLKYGCEDIIGNSLLFLFATFDNVAILCANVFLKYQKEPFDLKELDLKISESLKENPPVPFIPKTINETFEYKGRVFLNGDSIAIMPCVINDKEFGIGKRRCPGENLTYLLANQILKEMICKYKLVGNVVYKRQRFSYGPAKFTICKKMIGLKMEKFNRGKFDYYL